MRDAFFLTGQFREVEPPARLSFTFAWEDPDPDDVETLVELSFEDVGGSTEVGLTQGSFKTEERRALHAGRLGRQLRQARAALLSRVPHQSGP